MKVTLTEQPVFDAIQFTGNNQEEVCEFIKNLGMCLYAEVHRPSCEPRGYITIKSKTHDSFYLILHFNQWFVIQTSSDDSDFTFIPFRDIEERCMVTRFYEVMDERKFKALFKLLDGNTLLKDIPTDKMVALAQTLGYRVEKVKEQGLYYASKYTQKGELHSIVTIPSIKDAPGYYSALRTALKALSIAKFGKDDERSFNLLVNSVLA